MSRFKRQSFNTGLYIIGVPLLFNFIYLIWTRRKEIFGSPSFFAVIGRAKLDTSLGMRCFTFLGHAHVTNIFERINNWFFIITFPVRKLYVNMGQPLMTHVNVIHDQNLLKEKSILPEPTRRWILQHKQLGIQNYRLDSLNQNWQQQLGNGW